MPDTNRRLTALSTAMAVARSDLMGLLHQTSDELANLPHRLHRTSVHDDLNSTVSVLLSTCEHLDRAISNIYRLKEPDHGK